MEGCSTWISRYRYWHLVIVVASIGAGCLTHFAQTAQAALQQFLLAGPGPTYDAFEATGSGRSGHFRWIGGDRHDNAGKSVSDIGDFNGDGYDDVIVGAPWADHGPRHEAGRAYIILGGPSGSYGSGDLDDLAIQRKGIMISGAASDFQLGGVVSAAGDINGDGYDDVAVSATNATALTLPVGAIYIIFGKRTRGLPTPGFFVDTANLGADEGLVVYGVERGGHTGKSIADLGDVNGDGRGDLIVGADNKAYVIFSSWLKREAMQNPRHNYIFLDNPQPGDGIKIVGEYIGSSVDRAGDLNHDGVTDYALGVHEPGEFPSRSTPQYLRSVAYVIYGRRSERRTIIDLSRTSSGVSFIRNGINAERGHRGGDYIVAFGGFLDDSPGSTGRYADLLIGDPDRGYCSIDTPSSTEEGSSESGDGGSNKSGNDGTGGTDGERPVPVPRVGSNCNASLGEGESLATTNVGEAYALFGWPESSDIQTMGGSGITLDNFTPMQGGNIEGGALGTSLASADVTGDGVPEIATGDPKANHRGRRGSGVVYLAAAPAASENAFSGGRDMLPLAPEGSAGFKVITGAAIGSAAGSAVSSAGDVNGDGREDLIVGSPGYDRPRSGVDPAGIDDQRGRVDVILGVGSPEIDYQPEARVPAGGSLSVNPSRFKRTGDYELTVDPALPPGLSFNRSTGVISGTVSADAQADNTTYKVTVNDQSGQSASDEFRLVIVRQDSPGISNLYKGSRSYSEGCNKYYDAACGCSPFSAGFDDPECTGVSPKVKKSKKTLKVRLLKGQSIRKLRRNGKVKVKVGSTVKLKAALKAQIHYLAKGRIKRRTLATRRVSLKPGRLQRTVRLRIRKKARRTLKRLSKRRGKRLNRAYKRGVIKVSARAKRNGKRFRASHSRPYRF